MIGANLPNLLVTTLGEATAFVIALSALFGSVAAVIAAIYGVKTKGKTEDVKQKIENGHKDAGG